MCSILLLGAGNIALRHVQSIASDTRIEKIFVYDPHLLQDQVEEKFSHYADYIYKCDNLNDIYLFEVDLCLVCTTANVRGAFDYQMIKSKRTLLEKPVVNTLQDLLRIHRSSNLFVHYPFRAFGDLSKFIHDASNPVSIDVSGTNFAMLCNVWHFLDLICHLKNCKPTSIEFYDNVELIRSKREGFEDLVGRIAINFDDGSELIMDDALRTPRDAKNPYVTHGEERIDVFKNIDGATLVYRDGIAQSANISHRYPFVSELTHNILGDSVPIQYASFQTVFENTAWLLNQLNSKFNRDIMFT